VYNIRGEKVQAVTTPGTDQRVHITITPRTAPPAGKDPGKPPATPQP